MSDWFGVKDTVGPMKAGLDVEMPFPVFRGKRLLAAMKSGDVTQAEVDSCVKKMLQLRDRTTACQAQEPERSDILPEANALAREIVTSGMVLLKNEQQALPIQSTSRVALIGEYAKNVVYTGGGSASCKPQYHNSPLEILSEEFASVEYASGVRTRRIIPTAPKEMLRARNGQPGADVLFYNNDEPETPCITEHVDEPQIWMLGEFKPGLKVPGSHVRMSTTISPATSGHHTLAVRCTGSYIMTVDGKQVSSDESIAISTEQFIFNHILLERRVEVEMQAGRQYLVEVVMQGPAQLTVGEPTPYALLLAFEESYSEEEAIEEAVRAARGADVSIVYAGRDAQYESEGFDLEDIKLPANQTRLITAVAEASKRTVLVLHAGNPIDVSAVIEHVDAVLLAHFPGQEGAHGAADILTGRVCPSGRLATTWFKTLEDAPSFAHFPPRRQEDGSVTVRYNEGVAVGYRALNLADRVCWPFGFGLSYTVFKYSNLEVFVHETEKPGKVMCRVSVKNTGAVAGREVVQLYVRPPATSSVWRPAKELKAFCKTAQLNPGDQETIELEVDVEVACSYWAEEKRSWRVEIGEYAVLVGDLRAAFSITEEHYWNHL